MVRKTETDVSVQNDCIRMACANLAESLVEKNTEAQGRAFSGTVYGGKVLDPVDLLDFLVADKIRDLQGSDPSAKSEGDLLGLLVMKRAFVLFCKSVRESIKAARNKELVERAREVAKDPEVKKLRKRRIEGGGTGTSDDSSDKPIANRTDESDIPFPPVSDTIIVPDK